MLSLQCSEVNGLKVSDNYHANFILMCNKKVAVNEKLNCGRVFILCCHAIKANISLHRTVEAYDEFPYKVPVYIQNHNCRRAKTHPLLEGKTYIKEIYKTMSHS